MKCTDRADAFSEMVKVWHTTPATIWRFGLHIYMDAASLQDTGRWISMLYVTYSRDKKNCLADDCLLVCRAV